jgi:ribosomal protein L5
MRQEHEKRVRKKDRRLQCPQVRHATGRVRLTKRTVHWTRKDVGFEPASLPAAWVALYRRTGQEPTVTDTSKSVAQRRLKEGDPVGAKVHRTPSEAWPRREERVWFVRPEVRPFVAAPEKAVDARGNRTRHRARPGALPALMPYYDSYYKLITASTGERAHGVKRSRTLTAADAEQGRWYRRGRKRPVGPSSYTDPRTP